MEIRIIVGDVDLAAELNHTPTAVEIGKILPLTASFNTWGDEIYFALPVETDLDDTAQEEVAIGDLGYWPTGRAFCIFFGQTPYSAGGKIIPASAVNVIGRIKGDATRLKGVINEKEIRLEIVSQPDLL